ncbi:hypothetical protein BCEP27_190032 [Burkholderia cepacia]
MCSLSVRASSGYSLLPGLSLLAVHDIFECFAGGELHRPPRSNGDLLASRRIPAGAFRAVTARETAEADKLDGLATANSASDRLDKRVDRRAGFGLAIAGLLRHRFDEFLLVH